MPEGVGAKGEPLYPPPVVGPTTSVRGSVIVLDWLWLRQNGYFERYSRELGSARAILDVTHAEWVPFPFGVEHWRALDALGCTPEQEYALGKFNAEHVHSKVLMTMIQLAGKMGVTPWTALAQCHKLWQRSWQGGGMAVYRTGQQTARIEILDNPILKHHQFRNGIRGAIDAGISPFCKNPVVLEVSDERKPSSVVVRASWR